jgi:hypothetical protein
MMNRIVLLLLAVLFVIVSSTSLASDRMQIPANDQTVTPYGTSYLRLVQVRNVTELQNALKNAKPGDYIRLADGVYSGNFEITVSGSKSSPITLYGSRNAILEGRSIQSGYGLYLRANYWIVGGITVRNSLKGIMLDRANFNTIRGVEVHKIGDEGLHLRSFSSDNIVRDSWIHDTGLSTASYGEAVYIGSAISNWSSYSNGSPDKSDRNQVLANLLGPNVSAESVDIKEGTTGGSVRDNRFISTRTIVVDSWVDVKGNSYAVQNNIGYYAPNTSFRVAVAILTHINGWGKNNIVSNNLAYVSTGATLPTPPGATPTQSGGALAATLPPASATPLATQATTVTTAQPTIIAQSANTPLPSPTVAPTSVPATSAAVPTSVPTNAPLPTQTQPPTVVPTSIPVVVATTVPSTLPSGVSNIPAPNTVSARIQVPAIVVMNEEFSVSIRIDHPSRAAGGGITAAQVECRLLPLNRVVGSNARGGTHFAANSQVVIHNFPTGDWMLFTVVQPQGMPPVSGSGTIVKFDATALERGQGTIACTVDIIAANSALFHLPLAPIVFTVQ